MSNASKEKRARRKLASKLHKEQRVVLRNCEEKRLVLRRQTELHGSNEDDEEMQYVLESSVDETGDRFDELVLARALKANPFFDQQPLQTETEKKSGAPKNQQPDLPKPKKIRYRMTPEQLKSFVGPRFASLVELHDPNAPDPQFLVRLKATRNSVPVPPHWELKRAFLSTQHDRETGEFVLPPFVAETGVAAVRVNDEHASIAFAQKLQVAFQSPFPEDYRKVKTTSFGEVYFEGKDCRYLRQNFVPGVMSQRLRKALAMTDVSPPPWLVSMQGMKRLPPSYPFLRIPGLNAPIPSGALWGMGVGHWGQPARNEDGSLVFPEVEPRNAAAAAVKPATSYWGQMKVGLTAGSAAAVAPSPTPQPAEEPPPPAAPPQKPAVPMPPQFMPAAQPRAAPAPQATWAQEYVRRNVALPSGVMASPYLYEPLQPAGGVPPLLPRAGVPRPPPQ